MILPEGPILSEGDEVILFMDSDKEGWGHYSEFPVVDGWVFGLTEEDLVLFTDIRTQKAKDIDAAFIQNGLRYGGISSSYEYQSVELQEFVKYLK